MYLSAQEAADELGVSLTTLYSYVSRKGLRSQKSDGSKARLYWREDIERVKGSVDSARGDILVPSSSITLLTKEGPYYRGKSALCLAETETLESVSELLWGPASSDAFASSQFKPSPLFDAVLSGMGDAPTFEKISAVLPVLERANPRAFDLSASGYCQAGAQIMRCYAAIMCDRALPPDTPLHEALAKALSGPPGYSEVLRRMFVLYADHELDPSSYAVRAVANTGVSAYRIVGAGLASAMGRRLTFGKMEAFAQMMREIMTKADPREPILRRLREGEPIYGFGSRLYPEGDPRAAALLSFLNETQGGDPDVIRFNSALEAAREATGALPDFAIIAIFIDHKLGMAESAGSLCRMARIAGWIAHAIEQYHSQELVRPRTTYSGALPEHSGSNGEINPATRSASSARKGARSPRRAP